MIKLTRKGMFNKKPAGKWDEAYPSGNGAQGVLAMGDPLDETIIFNHERLFLPLPVNTYSVVPNMSDELPALRDMIRQGRYREATRHFLSKLSEKGFPPELLWTDPFHPAFDLKIRTGKSGDTSDYLRWLDFTAGEAGVTWCDARGEFVRRLFVSRKRNVVVIKLDAPSNGKLDCEISLVERKGGEHIRSTSVSTRQSATAQTTKPQTVNPQTVNPQTAKPQTTKPQTATNQTAVNHAAIPQTVISQAATPLKAASLNETLLNAAHINSASGDDEWLFFQSLYEVGNGGYCGIARLHVSCGRMEMHEDRIKIFDADEVIIIARIVVFEDSSTFSLSADITELAEIPADYEMLLKEHTKIHGELFGRLRLDLSELSDTAGSISSNGKGDNLTSPNTASPNAMSPNTASPNAVSPNTVSPNTVSPNGTSTKDICNKETYAALSNEELMEQARSGYISPAFIERMHDFGRYLLISSSGQLPPNLQGVWNGVWYPPWSSDYTLDENVQMMMWQVLPGNMPELAKSYFNLIESYVEDWKINAKLFYGCRGVLSSLRSTTSGLHKHFCEDFPMMFWTAGAGWLAQMFYDYWQFSGDDRFLSDHVVPLLKEIALFYEDFLVTGQDGKYEFIPSYSPENTPSNSDNPVAINATMDIAVAREVLNNLISACEQLDVETDSIPKWKDMLEKLPEYLINEDGALKEWSHSAFDDDYHHRHSSHLYPVFPGFEVTQDNTPELYRACLRAAELRLTDGIEAITGWGLAHLANISARLKDGELGFKALSRIMAKFLLPNLFTCHNEGELFQMDANLGFSAAILEMLVFSQKGYIELLPALPMQLHKGSVSGILLRGCITLDELQWDKQGKIISAALSTEIDQTITVKLPGVIASIEITYDSDNEGAVREQCKAELLKNNNNSKYLHPGIGTSGIKLDINKGVRTRLIISFK